MTTRSGNPMRRIGAAVAVFLLWACIGGSAHCDAVVDRLSVPGPIAFNAEIYRLSWSSHPSRYYYKQEYLPAGETNDHFRRMVLLEAIVQGTDIATVVSAQVNRLKQRKTSDPTVNFAIVRNPQTGDVILDFILSADDSKEAAIVEWNAYRYAVLKGANGNSGVLLLGVSRRAYGDAMTDFLRGLKSARPAEIDALAKFPLPIVQVRD